MAGRPIRSVVNVSDSARRSGVHQYSTSKHQPDQTSRRGPIENRRGVNAPARRNALPRTTLQPTRPQPAPTLCSAAHDEVGMETSLTSAGSVECRCRTGEGAQHHHRQQTKRSKCYTRTHTRMDANTHTPVPLTDDTSMINVYRHSVP